MKAQAMIVGALSAGLLAAGGIAATGAAPTTTADTATTLAAFSTPLDGPHGWGWDRHHDWDGRRDHDGGWGGHPWHWWHDSGISADTCRDGGGHVQWDRHRCDGGRFDDFRVR